MWRLQRNGVAWWRITYQRNVSMARMWPYNRNVALTTASRGGGLYVANGWHVNVGMAKQLVA